MIYDILPIIVIIISLAIIVFILIKKIPKVAKIDLERIPQEAQGQVKKELLEQRVTRKLSNFGRWIRPLGQKGKVFFIDYFNKFKNKISDWEYKYGEKHRESFKKQPQALKKEGGILLDEAKSLMKAGRARKAEEKYLKVVSIDPRNIFAYAGLGEIYYKNQELEGAKEAMEYVVKLAENGYGELEATDYVLLSLIYQDLGDYKGALRSIKEALKLEPNNPKNLDLLCKISIISKNRKEALRACERLARTNPDNEKIEEFRAEIKKIKPPSFGG